MSGGVTERVWNEALRRMRDGSISLYTAEGRAEFDRLLREGLERIEDRDVRMHAAAILRDWRTELLDSLNDDDDDDDEDTVNINAWGRMDVAKAALNGMLAHPERYKPRVQDTGKHWHDAIAEEAFDIADAVMRAAARRRQ